MSDVTSDGVVKVIEYGFPGPPGDKGDQGDQGIPGSSSNLFGTTLPDPALFADGATYAVLAGGQHTLYERQSGAWVAIAEATGSVAAEAILRAAADALLIPLTQKAAANGVATLDGSGTIPDAQIPATITRDTELTAAVNAAVTALIAGAPGALDTLNELAAALGNDANLAADLTNSIAANLATATGRAVALAIVFGG